MDATHPPAAAANLFMSNRASDREARTEAVLQTAIAIFNRHGFHTSSLDDVARALNVTKPALYRYFRSKDEILFAAARRGLDELMEAARVAAMERGPAALRLRQLLIRYGIVMLGEFGICVARTSHHELAPDSRETVRGMKREVGRVVRAVVEEGIRDGSLRHVDARIATFTLCAGLNGLGQWFNPKGPLSREEVSVQAVEILLAGILPQGQRPS